MLDGKKLFVDRLTAHIKELSRYLRYILTGHIVIAMVFIVSAMSVYYQKFLENIPDQFPSGLVIALLLGLATFHSPIQTMLKKADMVFLLPAEHVLSGYFTRTLVYSFVTQLYVLILTTAALAPLYSTAFAEGVPYGFILLVLLVIKVWSLTANWWMLRVRDGGTRKMDKIVRYALIVSVIYFFLLQEMLFLAIVTILLIVLFVTNYQFAQRQKALNWDLLIENDYLRMRSFYRLANMFTDVPHMETQVKKRYWLARLLTNAVPFRQQKAYTYLYRLTTVRSGEYFGIYLRLLVIGGLLIYFVPNQWLKLIFAILFVYMVFLQLLPLWKHHVTIVWLDLYPIGQELRKQSFVKWLQQLIAVLALVFAVLLVLIGNWMMAILMVLASILFVQMFIPSYLHKKMAQ
ncbi:ABC transporter permease [Gracilibacillus caseinilyticus]|uniref:ABC transporter permease n=1 Tax=Gracilibacillus caseinilyticus TaxID=2932256 RepID=A0ABY4EQU5_9BACI|nr:ABC transporter permease [Gracilibacillus caseinilyticus]UOQ46807.1 ABC transporter permease [Gracilibacillus caseinilyticus]